MSGTTVLLILFVKIQFWYEVAVQGTESVTWQNQTQALVD
jgi:hypothetical protein